jgi:hypothetical protein
MPIPLLSMLIGGATVLTGAVATGLAVQHGAKWYTATIPIWIGLILIVAGAIARNAAYRKHAMHAAAAVALLGALGSAPGLISLITGNYERLTAPVARTITLALMATFLVFAVKSFIDARKARTAAV